MNKLGQQGIELMSPKGIVIVLIAVAAICLLGWLAANFVLATIHAVFG